MLRTNFDGKGTGSAVVLFSISSIRFNFHRRRKTCQVPRPNAVAGITCQESICMTVLISRITAYIITKSYRMTVFSRISHSYKNCLINKSFPMMQNFPHYRVSFHLLIAKKSSVYKLEKKTSISFYLTSSMYPIELKFLASGSCKERTVVVSPALVLNNFDVMKRNLLPVAQLKHCSKTRETTTNSIYTNKESYSKTPCSIDNPRSLPKEDNPKNSKYQCYLFHLLKCFMSKRLSVKHCAI